MQSFVYLCLTIMPSGQGAAEVERRIGAASSSFVHLKRSLWGWRKISTATKGHNYQAIFQTILLYGCETWPLRAIDRWKLEAFDNDCLHYILQCCWIDRVPQLLYVITWTSVLFHSPCSSAISDGSGMQLDTQRESLSMMYFSPPLPN